MPRALPLILVSIFITSMFIIPTAIVGVESYASKQSLAVPAQILHDARVAIYNEDNLTAPAISAAENLTNNLDEITALLEGAGHSVELLTSDDILNHELITADYDVFIIVNNIPRPSISKLVKEFWLGGGGLMSFNGALSYLWFEGILNPAMTTDPYVTNWLYLPGDNMNVTSRHSTMKDYHVNDTVSERVENWATTSTAIIDSLDIGSAVTVLLANKTEPFLVQGFAVENTQRGGRIVHLPGDGSSIPIDFESIIVDSVEWLVPRPKGRIVYDLAHSPRLAVDAWDGLATVYSSVESYTEFRTAAVNHSYTFDKLYPSPTGNLTASRLAKYDVLVLVWPDVNYTNAEYVAVEDWVSGGGSILVLGDRAGLLGPGPGNVYINMMLQNFDMSLGTTDVLDFAVVSPETHFTLEECTTLYIGLRNYLSVIGDAVTIWSDAGNAVVAGQEFGQGRAILSADMNIFVNGQISEEDNLRFSLNVLNWLTASDAKILAYTDLRRNWGYGDAVSLALNDLGRSYQLFITSDYVDDFIDSQSWDLVIINAVNYALPNTVLDEIYSYVDGGGKLIMSYFDMDDASTHPLWSKLGVEYNATLSGEPDMYVWDATHPIFTEPNDHGGANYSAGIFFGDDGDIVTVLDGFTALAGSTPTVQVGKACITLSNTRQTLYNSYLIDTSTGDDDDSTYSDAVELWQNEIVFMTTPSDGQPFPIDPTTLLIIGGAAVAIIVILALAMRRRPVGKPKPKPKKKSKKK